MAKVDVNQLVNTPNQGYQKVDWFKLENDGESKKVRFPYKTIQEIEAYRVHKVKVPNLEYPISIDCLGNNCPFCASQNKHLRKTVVQGYIQVYNLETKKIEMWQKSSGLINRLLNILKYYPSAELANHVFNVVRSGNKNDKKTSYDFILDSTDNTTAESLGKHLPIFGNLVQSKTKEEMEYYMLNQSFPPKN